MDWYFDQTLYLLLLLLLPLLVSVIYLFKKWKKSRKAVFASEQFQEKVFSSSAKSSILFPILYILGFLFLIISIADVLHGTEEVKISQKTNNVIFLLDISNSMNAEDINPNRLIQAQNIMINTMSKMKNDKVGIVIFAGESISIMPLTTDYNAAVTYISTINTNMMKVQGTDFLKGMEQAAVKFKNISKGARKVILLSDGEDNEGNEESALSFAKKEGISITSVGIGSDEGAPIPEYIYGQLMGYKQDSSGETVISKRQTNALETLAEKTNGDYIDGNNLEQATTEIIESLKKKNSSTSAFIKSQNAVHYYQYFLAVSIFFFLLILLLNPRKDFNL
jgi:Ca-activated chloride channel family protein